MGVRARVVTSAGTLVGGLAEANLSLAVLTAQYSLNHVVCLRWQLMMNCQQRWQLQLRLYSESDLYGPEKE